MNLKLFSAIGLGLLLTMCGLRANDMSATDYANKFYKEWSIPRAQGDDSAGFVFAQFYHEVPPALQTDVLDQLLDRATTPQPNKNYAVISDVFLCLRNLGAKLNPTPRLEANLDGLGKDGSNFLLRRDVFQIVGRWGRAKDHDFIVAGMSDPNDEVRGAAIDALRDQPDAETTFQKFIQAHQNDPEYHTSVLYAKSGLEAIHQKTSGH